MAPRAPGVGRAFERTVGVGGRGEVYYLRELVGGAWVRRRTRAVPRPGDRILSVHVDGRERVDRIGPRGGLVREVMSPAAKLAARELRGGAGAAGEAARAPVGSPRRRAAERELDLLGAQRELFEPPAPPATPRTRIARGLLAALGVRPEDLSARGGREATDRYAAAGSTYVGAAWAEAEVSLEDDEGSIREAAEGIPGGLLYTLRPRTSYRVEASLTMIVNSEAGRRELKRTGVVDGVPAELPDGLVALVMFETGAAGIVGSKGQQRKQDEDEDEQSAPELEHVRFDLHVWKLPARPRGARARA